MSATMPELFSMGVLFFSLGFVIGFRRASDRRPDPTEFVSVPPAAHATAAQPEKGS